VAKAKYFTFCSGVNGSYLTNLGYARDDITQIYAHVIDKMKKKAAKKIEGFTKKKATG